MLRFVKWRKRAKVIIILVVIINMMLSSIVQGTNGGVTNSLIQSGIDAANEAEKGILKSTKYNIFGIKEITVIEGDRPADEAIDNSNLANTRVFYSNDPARYIAEALKIQEQECASNETYTQYINPVYNNYIQQEILKIGSSGDPDTNIKEFLEYGYTINGQQSIGFIQWVSDRKDIFAGLGLGNIETVRTYTNSDGETVEDTEEVEIGKEKEDEGIFSNGLWGGIASIFMWILRLIPVTIAVGIGKIISTLGAFITGSNAVEGLTLDTILFNELEITSIDFFSPSTDVTVSGIRDNVAIWYVAIRNLAVIALSIVLIYIGIRMAISSVAEDKARYKKMLMNWVTSLVLLFLLHYIMIIIIGINNSIVDIMKLARDTDAGEHYTNIMNQFAAEAYNINIDFITGIGYALMYLLLALMTLIFLLTYIKRMITIAFLIIIAPIITVTYSIDKMGDGKSQALNAWLKEFAYNVLIQVFHCIIYLALVQTSFNMLAMGSGGRLDAMIGNVVIAFMMVIFLYQAEDIVKNIFNFKASSMPKTIAQAAIFATAVNAIGSAGKKTAAAGGGGSSSRRNARLNRNQAQNGGTGPNAGQVRTGESRDETDDMDARDTLQNLQQGGNNENGRTSQNNNREQTTNNNQEPTENRNRGTARRVGASVLGGFVRGSVKATGRLVGLVAGAATGDLGAAVSGMMTIGGATSGLVNSEKQKAKQRRIARSYNNFVQMHPELDNKSQVEYSRMLLDQDIAPKNDVEREYLEALYDMNDTYERAGMSTDDAGDQVEKVIKRVQAGEISETMAPVRLFNSGKNKIRQIAQNRRQRGNINFNNEENNQGQ